MISRRGLLKSSLFAGGLAGKSWLEGQTSLSESTAKAGVPAVPLSGRRPIAGRRNKYLFVDDYNVESIDNLARRLHQPQKVADNVVIRAEHRWENAGIQIRTTPVWLPEE